MYAPELVGIMFVLSLILHGITVWRVWVTENRQDVLEAEVIVLKAELKG